jgi:hypothetical protein
MKVIIAAVAAAALLGGCATAPYGYDTPYSYGYAPAYPYTYDYYGPGYYYGPPAIGGGVVIGGSIDSNRGDWRGHGGDSGHWRGGDRGNWRGDDRGNWRGDDRGPGADRPWEALNPGPRHGPDARTPEANMRDRPQQGS